MTGVDMRTDRGDGEHWDLRYAGEAYAFGTEPNPYLVDVVSVLPRGLALSLGEGEGRNAVWLAEQGFTVESIDLSAVGVAKTLRLAAERGVTVEAAVGSIADFAWPADRYDLIIMMFVHPAPALRAELHRRLVASLRIGGSYVLEAYTPAQVARGGPGPREVAHAMSEATLREELHGLEIVRLVEIERDSSSARRPTGPVSVVQLHARRGA
jgi:SAM-dependent methyltransferase